MGIAQDLVQGFAGAAGDTGTVNRLEKQKDRTNALSDTELEANTQMILQDVQRLQNRRAALPEGSPEIEGIDKSLHEHRQAFSDIFHPIKQPNNFTKLSGFLQRHVANQVTPDRMAGLQASAAGSAPKSQLTPEEARDAALVSAGLKPRAQDHKPDAENWVPADITLSDGRKISAQRNTKDGSWTDLAGKPISQELLSTATVEPKANTKGKPVRAWTRKGGKMVSVLLDPMTNKVIPDSENSDVAPPASMTGRVSTGFYHFVDDQGQVHQVQETKTSGPAGSGGGVPKTPGEAKSRFQKPDSGDKVIGHKETPVQAKAHNTFVASSALSDKADLVAQHPDDAVNQKRLAVALERQAAGRFTTQALDYIVKAGWGNTIEQWANNPSTGALPKDVMRQLIDGAHQEKQSSFKAWQETLSGGQTSAPTAPAQPSGKAVSLAKAKQLPQNKGKSDDEIRKDIEAHGHKVID